MNTGLVGRRAWRMALIACVALGVASCSSNDDTPARPISGVSRSTFTEDAYGVSTSPRVADSDDRIRKGGGSFKLGSPYKVAGRWYVPRENPDYDDYGVASWYGADFHGRKTANGEIFDSNALTAAHPTMPLPSYAIVTNLDNGKSVMVRVNDRGPYVNDRIIDMSYAASKALGYTSKGRARVRVQYAGRAPLNGDDTRERRYLASVSDPQNRYPSTALASSDYVQPAYSERRLPAESYDRWSAIGYRSQLAGKAPPPAPGRPVYASNADDSYRNAPYDNRRMSLSGRAPEAPDPYGSGRSYVQVGMFRERSNAERLRRELGSLGPVEVAPIQVDDGGEVYRVRVGPLSPDQAARTQSQITTYGVADASIVSD